MVRQGIGILLAATTLFTVIFTLSGIIDCHSEESAMRYTCRYTDEKITIDGIFNELSWQKAEKINFYHIERGLHKTQTHPPAYSQTTARLLWDNNYLYIAMEAEDKDIWATLTEHDAVLCREDVLEIFLKPKRDKYSYYEFEISPKNITWDIFYPSRGVASWDRKWSSYESNLKSATKVYGTLNNWQDMDERWTLEVAIPFSALSEVIESPPRNGDEWYFALCRYDYSVYLEDFELSSSARLKEAWFHRYEDYDILVFKKLDR